MTVTACPLCGGSTTRHRYGAIEQCTTCGLARTRTPMADLDQLYDQAYFSQRNDYLANAPAFRAMFHELLDLVQPHCSTGRLLDVGCGPGLLLEVAQQRGYTASGCDISRWAVDYANAHGLEARLGALNTLHYATAEFDVVVINHTLEHVPDFIGLLIEARRILTATGIVAIGVPNFDSLMARLMRERWAGLLPDQHLWHFTTRTLSAALHKAGFTVLAVHIPPVEHRHRNPVKDAVLQLVSRISNAWGRGDALVAIAAKG